MYIEYRSPPLVSTFCACLTIISLCAPGEWKTGNCIWTIFTRVNMIFDTRHPIHRNGLPLRVVRSWNNVYFIVRFPLSDESTWVNWQKNSIGTDSESLLTAQPSHIRRNYNNFTLDIIYALCAIAPSCLHSLHGHYLYNSLYPHPRWDDSNYSYLFIIRKGTSVCGHSAFTGSLFQWAELRMNKKCEVQKHKSTVLFTTFTRVECFLMWHRFSWPNPHDE